MREKEGRERTKMESGKICTLEQEQSGAVPPFYYGAALLLWLRKYSRHYVLLCGFGSWLSGAERHLVQRIRRLTTTTKKPFSRLVRTYIQHLFALSIKISRLPFLLLWPKTKKRTCQCPIFRQVTDFQPRPFHSRLPPSRLRTPYSWHYWNWCKPSLGDYFCPHMYSLPGRSIMRAPIVWVGFVYPEFLDSYRVQGKLIIWRDVLVFGTGKGVNGIPVVPPSQTSSSSLYIEQSMINKPKL